VDIIDPVNGLPCAMGLICGVIGMTFQGAPIAPSLCGIILISIKKGVVKLRFPSLAAFKVKDMPNGIMLWHEKDLVGSKCCVVIIGSKWFRRTKSKLDIFGNCNWSWTCETMGLPRTYELFIFGQMNVSPIFELCLIA
jgi:hypothetical protein